MLSHIRINKLTIAETKDEQKKLKKDNKDKVHSNEDDEWHGTYDSSLCESLNVRHRPCNNNNNNNVGK